MIAGEDTESAVEMVPAHEYLLYWTRPSAGSQRQPVIVLREHGADALEDLDVESQILLWDSHELDFESGRDFLPAI